ncbi:MAG: biotin/lipoyl-binding protein [Acidobacteriota bacterium]|nr:biotin/lipoyl-binding protein [Acidobacteriota bacterium]
MKLRVDIDGESALLDLQQAPGDTAYSLAGVANASGTASIAETMPGVFSVLLENQSYTASVLRVGDDLEVWIGNRRYAISIGDLRDRSANVKKAPATGPMEIRAQMPGKVVKLLVEQGAEIQAGQGLIVVEAMKMQNEMKSPKGGVVSKIYATEDATVAAGEKLMVIE